MIDSPSDSQPFLYEKGTEKEMSECRLNRAMLTVGGHDETEGDRISVYQEQNLDGRGLCKKRMLFVHGARQDIMASDILLQAK